jgi:serine protease Do
VVGINELGGSGIGFAIPASIARWVLDQTLQGGALVRGWIGIMVQPVRALGESSGALVGAVQPHSPAAKAGLEPGDLLESLAGERVDVRFLEQIPEFSRRVALLRPGAQVPIVVRRGDQRLEVEVAVEPMEPYRGEEREIRSLGITAQEVTRPFAFLHRLPEGVLITGVRPGRPVDAARPRPNVGDVLLELAGQPVATLDQVEQALSSSDAKQLLAEVWRAGERVATVIELKESTSRRWGGELPKAWLGVATQVLTPDLASALGEPGRKGFRVTRVFPGTSAARSGLEVGDLIAEVDGRPLTAAGLQDAEQLRRRLQEREPGETASLGVVRGGEQLTLEVELEEEPRGAAEAAEVRHEALEVTVRAVALEDRLRELWGPDLAGVIVAEATTGGWAHLAGLRVGDLVQKVDGQVVKTPEAFAEVVAAALERGASAIALLVRRGGRTVFVFIEPAVEEVL